MSATGSDKRLELGTVDRVIYVSLTEDDWKAFLAVTPHPVRWIRERIREAIQECRDGSDPAAPAS
ncbi:MAG: hypothetical protein AB7G23_03505 [Vicinamibacterales bacterium]